MFGLIHGTGKKRRLRSRFIRIGNGNRAKCVVPDALSSPTVALSASLVSLQWCTIAEWWQDASTARLLIVIVAFAHIGHAEHRLLAPQPVLAYLYHVQTATGLRLIIRTPSSSATSFKSPLLRPERVAMCANIQLSLCAMVRPLSL